MNRIQRTLDHRHQGYALSVWALLCLLLGSCGAKQHSSDPIGRRAKTESPFNREVAILNMPTNVGDRCFGISVVVEAVLEAELLDQEKCETSPEVARQIYRDLLEDRSSCLPTYICDEDGRVAITSVDAIEALSTQVSDLYKRDFTRLMDNAAGRQQLADMEHDNIKSEEKLLSILKSDPDHREVFFVVGMREFPDGSIKPSHHVVILEAQQGKTVVYDSNDPGKPIPFQIESAEVGLRADWVCQYRDTGMETTQLYHIISKSSFIRAISKSPVRKKKETVSGVDD
jgi:hypothetical protein